MKSDTRILRWLRRLALLISVGAAAMQLRQAHAQTCAGVRAGVHTGVPIEARVPDLGASHAPLLRCLPGPGPDLRSRRALVPAAEGHC